jgi:hypothetical protein
MADYITLVDIPSQCDEYDINAEAQSLFSLLLLEKYSSACIQMTKDGTDKRVWFKVDYYLS